jgi:hypothetical protein
MAPRKASIYMDDRPDGGDQCTAAFEVQQLRRVAGDTERDLTQAHWRRGSACASGAPGLARFARRRSACSLPGAARRDQARPCDPARRRGSAGRDQCRAAASATGAGFASLVAPAPRGDRSAVGARAPRRLGLPARTSTPATVTLWTPACGSSACPSIMALQRAVLAHRPCRSRICSGGSALLRSRVSRAREDRSPASPRVRRR